MNVYVSLAYLQVLFFYCGISTGSQGYSLPISTTVIGGRKEGIVIGCPDNDLVALED